MCEPVARQALQQAFGARDQVTRLQVHNVEFLFHSYGDRIPETRHPTILLNALSRGWLTAHCP
ncbi:hypothetical protein Sme01_70250 [Sphaerisporangium melleum]|uniref:Uncharacterized protein n=1 Tax=Sphaerisporangium melleum TaxID=321316 RepID=A0A917RNM9_9ACTN|nr:hypothetical protein GCM10007964_66710 [Sphaerisporangium melleum]GII74549.1 hypothetical protein Sme01_70250 [Sphaerisporangium melleum]